MRYVFLAICIMLTGLAALLFNGWRPPYRYDPWAPIDLRAAPGIFTSFRLYRLNDHPAQCLDALTAAGAPYRAVSDRDEANGCGWHNAVLLRGTSIALLAHPTLVTCPLAASLVLLDRDVLQPSARSRFGTGVAVLDHVGSYNCRPIQGENGNLSSHANARALDLTGIRLSNGVTISVARDWHRPVTGDFLRATQQQACPYFGMILGPDYNGAHAGHLHLQAGSAGWCR